MGEERAVGGGAAVGVEPAAVATGVGQSEPAGGGTAAATCGPAMTDALAAPVAAPSPAGTSALAQEVALLRQEVARLDQELVALRMDRRKVMLEELARLEEPLVEMGVIARRTREPRHRGSDGG